MISNFEYDVALSLPKGATYFGKAAITFNLTKVPDAKEEPIFLDFFGTDVANLVVNDKPVAGLEVSAFFREGKLILDSNLLKVGANKVTVELINNYRNDGYGIHSFTDKVDMHQYLYTQFEPNYCHYVFPSFDQPDIRAKWSLSTLAPKEWSIISNEYEDQNLTKSNSGNVMSALTQVASSFNQSDLFNSQVQAQDSVTVFRQSYQISPYLFAIVAGPYTYVESKVVEEGLPPMRVYLRQSVIDSVEKRILDEMLTSTLVGMRFYKDLFGIPYQFSKYDQIFVPEFNAGAMENVACVTFNEAELRRGQTMTLDEQLTLTNTILHELAH
jgi:aminopeptidase N